MGKRRNGRIALDLLHLQNLDDVLLGAQKKGQLLFGGRGADECLRRHYSLLYHGQRSFRIFHLTPHAARDISTRPAMSRIRAARPSPRIVAPVIPCTFRKFVSRLFTTTCCWPRSSSTSS